MDHVTNAACCRQARRRWTRPWSCNKPACLCRDAIARDSVRRSSSSCRRAPSASTRASAAASFARDSRSQASATESSARAATVAACHRAIARRRAAASHSRAQNATAAPRSARRTGAVVTPPSGGGADRLAGWWEGSASPPLGLNAPAPLAELAAAATARRQRWKATDRVASALRRTPCTSRSTLRRTCSLMTCDAMLSAPTAAASAASTVDSRRPRASRSSASVELARAASDLS
mmetsp:Transcript_6312/g.22473  ORF Transcript_6312/g.22473 Transcript_6312/m.22473 type:complete len:235 (-) Transcript_6312:2370-3074(-)